MKKYSDVLTIIENKIKFSVNNSLDINKTRLFVYDMANNMIFNKIIETTEVNRVLNHMLKDINNN